MQFTDVYRIKAQQRQNVIQKAGRRQKKKQDGYVKMMQMTGSDLPSRRPYPWAMSSGCQSERTFLLGPNPTWPTSLFSSKLGWRLWIILLENRLYLGFIIQVGLGDGTRGQKVLNVRMPCSVKLCPLENVCLLSED